MQFHWYFRTFDGLEGTYFYKINNSEYQNFLDSLKMDKFSDLRNAVMKLEKYTDIPKKFNVATVRDLTKYIPK